MALFFECMPQSAKKALDTAGIVRDAIFCQLARRHLVLATFLVNKESDTKTVQGLLRHANVSTTLGLYAQSVNTSMVEAQEAMLTAILRNGSNAVN